MRNLACLLGFALMLSAHAEPLAQRIGFTPDSMSDWHSTAGTEFRVEDAVAYVAGTDWDHKIYRTIELTPATAYRLSGTGKGKIMVLLYPSTQWEGDKLCQLNLGGEEFRSNYLDFTTPAGEGKHLLVIHCMRAPGAVRELNIAVRAETEEEIVLLDLEKLRAQQPSPQRVRGFMVAGDFTDETAQRVIDWGANAIRYQIDLSDKKNERTLAELLPLCLERLETAVKAARARNIKVIVDLQSAMAFHRDKQLGFWQQPTLAEDFVEVWTQIARRLLPYGDSVWGYDLCNEPLDRAQLPYPPREWRPVALKILAAIRAIDPSVWIIYEPGPGGGASAYGSMQPLPDYRVIYSFHYYSPHAYTHQGILNIEQTDLAKVHEQINIAYPGKIGAVEWNKAQIDRSLQCVRDFQKKYPVPFFVGEFSAARWAPGAERYLQDCIEVFEENGWSWAYHALNDWSGWSLEFDESYWIDALGWNHPNRPRQPVAGMTKRGEVLKNAFKKNRSQ
jgi:aryl-phospho-beta-D-glucosidase BglC (GH1 family)